MVKLATFEQAFRDKISHEKPILAQRGFTQTPFAPGAIFSVVKGHLVLVFLGAFGYKHSLYCLFSNRITIEITLSYQQFG